MFALRFINDAFGWFLNIHGNLTDIDKMIIADRYVDVRVSCWVEEYRSAEETFPQEYVLGTYSYVRPVKGGWHEIGGLG